MPAISAATLFRIVSGPPMLRRNMIFCRAFKGLVKFGGTAALLIHCYLQ